MKYLLPLILALFIAQLSFASTGKTKNKLIDAKRVKKISYLVAGSMGFGKSSFGHSYLRFSYSNKRFSSLDPVVEFLADVPMEDLNILKGMGIGENYKVKIVSSNYKQIKYHHNQKEDRSLTSFALALNPEQMQNLTAKVNELLKDGSEREYSFFKVNCATLVSSVLKESLQVRGIKGIRSIIPVKIPALLKKYNLLTGEEVTDHGVSQKRQDIYDEKFPKDLIGLYPLKLQNIEKQLISKNASLRILAYTKLHMLRQKLSPADDKKLKMALIRLTMLETQGIKFYTLPYFLKKEAKLSNIEMPLLYGYSSKAKIQSTDFKAQGSKVSLQVNLHYRKPGRRNRGVGYKKRTASYQIKSLSHKDGQIFFGDQVITKKYLKNMAKTSFQDDNLYINSEIVRYNKKPYILTTVGLEIGAPEKKIGLLKENTISVRNGHKINKIPTPMCYAVTETQRLFNTRVIFAPESEPLSEEKALNSIKSLYQGKIIVIPGFANARSFTASLDQEKLAKILKARHQQEYNFTKRAKAWFKKADLKLRADNIVTIKNLISEGITPELIFQVKGRKTKNNIKIGHAVLVTEIKEDKDYYYFGTYDPNFGLQNIRSQADTDRINKKLKEKSSKSIVVSRSKFKMRKSDSKVLADYYEVIDPRIAKISLETENAFNLILLSENFRKKAIKTYEIMGINEFRFSDFFN